MIKLEAPAIGYRGFAWAGGCAPLSAVAIGGHWPITKEPQVAKCAFADGQASLRTMKTPILGKFTVERLPAVEPIQPEHRSPAESCTCGIYAHSSRSHWIGGVLKGIILGYGKLIVHPDGFRAEKAEIVAILQTPASPRADQQSIACAYGARLVDGWDEALTLAKEQGGEEIPYHIYSEAKIPSWTRTRNGSWEYHDHISRDKDPAPITFDCLPDTVAQMIQTQSDFYDLLAEKRAEAKVRLRDDSILGVEITITIEIR